jgi:hypothetical protein
MKYECRNTKMIECQHFLNNIVLESILILLRDNHF